MATHPYISGPGNVTQMIQFLRKNFPATVNSDTVKRLGLASNNESYVINVLQFLKLVDEQGKRTDKGHEVMTIHDDPSFHEAFSDLVRTAYADLFELRGDDAWNFTRNQLTSYFRSVDKTSDIIGSRQAGVFIALRELAGHQASEPDGNLRAKPSGPRAKPATSVRPKPAQAYASGPPPAASTPPPTAKVKADMALTVRIEINLPAEGTQETYDAIFKSIKANLFP